MRPSRQKRRMKELIHFTTLFIVLLLISVCILAWLLPSSTTKPLTTTTSSSSQQQQQQQQHNNQHQHENVSITKTKKTIMTMTKKKIGLFRGSKHQNRIAILLPFVGDSKESIPSYLNLFCAGAAGAADIVDFLIIHNGILDNIDAAAEQSGAGGSSTTTATSNRSYGLDCPDNVKFISLGTSEVFAEYLLRVIDHKHEEQLARNVSRRRLITLVSKHIEACPYCLVEFKPALGYIFQDYITQYTHWGYSDIDMLYGDLGRWITPTEMQDYDIVTYSYGDQQRLYVRGQFTFHKNNHNINQIWRQCKYLSDLDTRLVSVVHGDTKYKFESAEGCYSVAVLSRTDIRVKYAVKAWTDIHEDDTAYTHGIYISRQRNNEVDKVVVYKAESPELGKELLDLATASTPWFEKDRVYKDKKQSLQEPVGAMEEISLPSSNNKNSNDSSSSSSAAGAAKKKKKCMYWVQDKYQPQLCLPDNAVSSTETIYWVDGKLYKQSHRNTPLQTRGVITGPYFHFQEWKRYFRASQLAPLHYSSPVSLFVLVKEGAIPMLPTTTATTTASATNTRPAAYYSHSSMNRGGSASSSTALVPSPLQILPQNWKEATHTSRTLLPSRSYCLISGPRKFPPQPPAPACYQQVSWQDGSGTVDIISGAPGWTDRVRIDLDVTLVLTLQLTNEQASDETWLSDILSKIVIENLTRWKGQPCVIVIHIAGGGGPRGEAITNLKQHFIGDSELPADLLENTLIAVVLGKAGKTVSRKALMNMAIDVVPTRWYISGIELERGLVISSDAAYFAHRALLTYDNDSWDVFLIPQFAVLDDNNDDDDKNGGGLEVTLSDLETMKDNNEIRHPSEVEKASCDKEIGVRLDKVEELWWHQVKAVLDSTYEKGGDEDLTRTTAESIQAMETSLLQYLTDEHHMKMFALDESPILMIDNVRTGGFLRTNEIAREVEELGGKRCYNGLRIAQLAALGYRFSSLTTFAVSNAGTREAATGGAEHGGDDESQPAGSSRCDGCFMFGDDEHEDILEDIIGDEIRRPGKTAVLWGEL